MFVKLNLTGGPARLIGSLSLRQLVFGFCAITLSLYTYKKYAHHNDAGFGAYTSVPTEKLSSPLFFDAAAGINKAFAQNMDAHLVTPPTHAQPFHPTSLTQEDAFSTKPQTWLHQSPGSDGEQEDYTGYIRDMHDVVDRINGTWITPHCFLPETQRDDFEAFIRDSIRQYNDSRRGDNSSEIHRDICVKGLEDRLRDEYGGANNLCDFSRYRIPVFPNKVFWQKARNGGSPVKQLADLRPRMSEMPRIAFFIMVFMDPEHVLHLVKRLHDPQHMIMLQLSPSSDPNFKNAIREGLKQGGFSYENVFVIEWGEMVYGTAMDVEAIMAAARHYFTYWNDWDFFIPLGGSDYSSFNITTIASLLHEGGPKTWVQPANFPLSVIESNPHTPDNATCLDGEDSRNEEPLKWIQYDRAERWSYGCMADRKATEQVYWRKPWYLTQHGHQWCKTYPLSHGIFHRRTVREMIESEEGRKAYAYFRVVGFAAVEHYWATFLLSRGRREGQLLRKMPCYMSWSHGENSVRSAAIGNTILTMAQKNIVDDVREKGIPFLRKIQSSSPGSLELRNYLDSLPS